MSNLIDRQAAIDALNNWFFNSTDERLPKQVIEALPSAEPEIIRCKDCKWKQGYECVRFAELRIFPDDFCSRAERRTDERPN